MCILGMSNSVINKIGAFMYTNWICGSVVAIVVVGVSAPHEAASALVLKRYLLPLFLLEEHYQVHLAHIMLGQGFRSSTRQKQQKGIGKEVESQTIVAPRWIISCQCHCASLNAIFKVFLFLIALQEYFLHIYPQYRAGSKDNVRKAK
ncbi:hypothetical protein BCR41DRAFT_374438 [Lobosporangium transversale]|uniref:Uncharacterized protein n=1 Tax=Lobosporangium transversale TaxID=64571 RepID=A0A1Y2GAG9_9FUNG|nr:hypothetical protein BCR41DRAFT_374438 [Lobosporangium transversale]ORZ05543.1 hypothetical protein BCR41DRAFT_374438 [Lobosporangium transversale]|eukprot:XP_021877117.1 hypothetical protein BCR41DRAFT_374438 [Lobosporangium transversale]